MTPQSQHTPRLEVFCRGSGCVVVATLDIFCEPAVDLKNLAGAVTMLDSTSLVSTIGNQAFRTNFSMLADECANKVMGLMSPAGEIWSLPAYPIVSVIAATGSSELDHMPSDGGPVHRAMHALARGQAGLPSASKAFLPYWSGRGDFSWAPSELVYILDTGSAQLRQAAALQRPHSSAMAKMTSEHHRLLTLTRVHFAADLCLMKAATQANSDRLTAWADVAADRQSRLYGPAPASYDFWSFASRAFIENDPDATNLIATRRNNSKLQGLKWPPYPTP